MRQIFRGGPQAPQPSLSPAPQQQFGSGVENIPPQILAAMLRGDEHLTKEEEAHAAQKRMALSDLMAQRAQQQPAQNAAGMIGQGMAAYAQGMNARARDNEMAASANQWMPTVVKDG